LWPDALALYRGDFLADFYLPDANTFEEWVSARRAGFQRQMLDALARLAEVTIAEGRYDEAEGRLKATPGAS
jgi:DNA-binding SARP family transcriptional activator